VATKTFSTDSLNSAQDSFEAFTKLSSCKGLEKRSASAGKPQSRRNNFSGREKGEKQPEPQGAEWKQRLRKAFSPNNGRPPAVGFFGGSLFPGLLIWSGSGFWRAFWASKRYGKHGKFGKVLTTLA